MRNICILSGIHRGAIIGITDNPVTIGGDEDCDALLSDVSAAGAAIRVARRPDDGMVATAIRGTVFRGMRRMPAEKEIRLTEGSVIRIGGVSAAPGDDLATAERAVGQDARRGTLLKCGGVCILCLALFGAIGVVGGPADAYNSITKAQARSTVPSASVGDAVGALEREIAGAGLSGAVGVVRESAGRIAATGSVNPEQRKAWDEIVRWFDGRFGSVVTLDARLAQRSDDIVLPFRIVSVRGGPGPRVVIQNGDAFPVGAILPGGWEVRRIAGLAVVLARGDREIAISF